jgi:hypothetical protein
MFPTRLIGDLLSPESKAINKLIFASFFDEYFKILYLLNEIIVWI